MTAITPFVFENERLVRVIEIGGEPWFVGKDVCGCLELGNHRDALSRLEEDERRLLRTRAQITASSLVPGRD